MELVILERYGPGAAWPDVYRGIEVSHALWLVWQLGTAVVLVLVGVRLLLRRRFRLRPGGAIGGLVVLAVGTAMLLARGVIMDSAADAAAATRATTPIPVNEVDDGYSGPSYWTGNSRPTRTLVVGEDTCDGRRLNLDPATAT